MESQGGDNNQLSLQLIRCKYGTECYYVDIFWENHLMDYASKKKQRMSDALVPILVSAGFLLVTKS